MSNRHQRRTDISAFRRNARHDHLVTHLIAASTPLGQQPMLSRLVLQWHSQIQQRCPVCICCRTHFAKGARAGGYLFATTSGDAGTTSLSVVCIECWSDRTPGDIEHHCARVLGTILPGGRFIDVVH